MDKKEILKKYFGYDDFREGQEEIIDALAAGSDVLGVMPTGAGKSLCYQIPALLFPGITLVVSPLISLMKDQVGALLQAGVATAYINTSLTVTQMEAVMEKAEVGKYRLIFVAPERLQTPRFLHFCTAAQIDFIAVDEAHCVSQWGHDFRAAYLQIADFIERLPYRPRIGAFTATATQRVREDIISLLGLDDPIVFVKGFDRPNLFFDVRRPRGKFNELLHIIESHGDKSGIIYCSARKTVEEVTRRLEQTGYKATRYHAGLGAKERRDNQEDFVFDRKPIMVATNAFGMGIDKSNVSYVVHYNMPKNIESYYQEAGRAGRDGEPADCILLFEKKDIMVNRFLIENGDGREHMEASLKSEIIDKEMRQLNQMIAYCEADTCYRKYVLEYFGETAAVTCENCGNCCGDYETLDITAEAVAAVAAVAEIRRPYGLTLIADVLHGSKNKRVKELHMTELHCYGSFAAKSLGQIKDLLRSLVQLDFLNQSGMDYPVLEITEKGMALLNGEETAEVRLKTENAAAFLEEAPPVAMPSPPRTTVVNEDLFARLRQLRFEIAQNRGVPAYVIFSDAALKDMCKRLPDTMAEFLDVSGVGKVKQQQYGPIFLKEIAMWSGKEGLFTAEPESEPEWEEPLLFEEKSFSPQKPQIEDVPLPTEPQFEEVPLPSDSLFEEMTPPPEYENDGEIDLDFYDEMLWSRAEDEKLLALLRGGAGIEETANQLQCSVDAIFQRLKAMNRIHLD